MVRFDDSIDFMPLFVVKSRHWRLFIRNGEIVRYLSVIFTIRENTIVSHQCVHTVRFEWFKRLSATVCCQISARSIAQQNSLCLSFLIDKTLYHLPDVWRITHKIIPSSIKRFQCVRGSDKVFIFGLFIQVPYSMGK